MSQNLSPERQAERKAKMSQLSEGHLGWKNDCEYFFLNGELRKARWDCVISVCEPKVRLGSEFVAYANHPIAAELVNELSIS